MSKIIVAPSILSADFSVMKEEIINLEQAGAEYAHIDVMDGVFVPNISFGPKFQKEIRPYVNMTFDTHLMIVHPEKFVPNFVDAGSDIITAHYEACGDNLINVLKLIKSYNVRCGAVINPDTPVKALEVVVDECDMILLMSVFPGFGGQKFIDYVLPKVEQAAELIYKSGKKIDLEIDGGITLENVRSVKDAGANVIVAGSTVFKEKDRAAVIRRLREI